MPLTGARHWSKQSSPPTCNLQSGSRDCPSSPYVRSRVWPSWPRSRRRQSPSSTANTPAPTPPIPPPADVDTVGREDLGDDAVSLNHLAADLEPGDECLRQRHRAARHLLAAPPGSHEGAPPYPGRNTPQRRASWGSIVGSGSLSLSAKQSAGRSVLPTQSSGPAPPGPLRWELVGTHSLTPGDQS